MPALLWFRRDLRLRDLPPLLRAAADSDEVLACFVLDPRLEASSGGRRMQFLCDSLRQLRDDLDGRLLVTRGRPEERIPAIAKEVDAPVGACLGGLRALSAGDATIGCARRWATCRWWPRDRRIWCRRGASPRTTASRTRCSPRSSADGAKWGGGQPARSGPKSAHWVDPTQLGKRAKPVEIPDPGVELDLPAGEAAARRQWKAVRRRRPRPLLRRPRPARPRGHQPDVGASEVRHDPPADDGRRLGPASRRRASILAAVGISRLLRRGSASLAG